MTLYHIQYNSSNNPHHEIIIDEIPCTITEKSVCWPGRRLSKSNLNIIESSTWMSSTVHLEVYSLTKDILPFFKDQVIISLKHKRRLLRGHLNLVDDYIYSFISINGEQVSEREFQKYTRWYPMSTDLEGASLDDEALIS